MPWPKTLAGRRGGKKGNFTESRSGLLSLFDDPDGRGERNWRQTFGYDRRPEKPGRGRPFIAREAQKSSSGSK